MDEKQQIQRNQQEMVLALRSGRYRQLNGAIHDDTENGFCFAGLGLKLFVQDPKAMEKWAHFDHYDELAEKLGLDVKHSTELGVDYSNALNYLIRMNNEGKTFNQLADILEKEFGFEKLGKQNTVQKMFTAIANIF